ncbi:MAG: hypothetical protein ACO24P_00735 [Candidatus Nanopelagicaceae bacterium]
MKTLPFVVKPKRVFANVRIGREDIGIIEIEKRGYLTVSEKAFVDAVMQGADAITSVVALATRISSKTGHTTEESYTAIMGAIQGDLTSKFAIKVKEEYPDELGAIVTQMAESVQKRAIAAATVLIKSRIDPEWTVDDTLEQDPELINAFAEFYGEEEAGIPVGIEETVEEPKVEEIVGKSTEENGES